MNIRNRLLFAVVLLLGVTAAAVVGYQVLGGGRVRLLDAIYMAVITLAGVGYGEIVETSHNPALRVFNIFVVLFGVGVTVYVFSALTAFLVEGDIRRIFWRRKMQKRISELKDHYIVCGLGDTGRHAVQELRKMQAPFVVIEADEATVQRLLEQGNGLYRDMLYIIGDATDEAVLNAAGMERAFGIIVGLASDKDNLVITVVARQQNLNLRIVARYTDAKFAERMLKAGANSTVSPNHIGGLRLASEVLRPHVVGFLDLMLQEKSRTLRIEEIVIPQRSHWVGMKLEDLKLRGRFNLLPLAVKNSPDPNAPKFWVNPPDTVMLQAGSVVIVMGDVNEVKRARREVQPERAQFLAARQG